MVRRGRGRPTGAEVVINCLPEQADAARALADEAYRVGASRVEIMYADPHLQKAQVLHAPEEMLGADARPPAAAGPGLGARRSRR